MNSNSTLLAFAAGALTCALALPTLAQQPAPPVGATGADARPAPAPAQQGAKKAPSDAGTKNPVDKAKDDGRSKDKAKPKQPDAPSP